MVLKLNWCIGINLELSGGVLHLDARTGMYEETPLHIKYMDLVYSVSMTIKEGKKNVLALKTKLDYKHYYILYGLQTLLPYDS